MNGINDLIAALTQGPDAGAAPLDLAALFGPGAPSLPAPLPATVTAGPPPYPQVGTVAGSVPRVPIPATGPQLGGAGSVLAQLAPLLQALPAMTAGKDSFGAFMQGWQQADQHLAQQKIQTAGVGIDQRRLDLEQARLKDADAERKADTFALRMERGVSNGTHRGTVRRLRAA